MFSSTRIIGVGVGPRKDRIEGMWSAHNFWARVTFEVKDHFFAKPREWDGLFHYHDGWREVVTGKRLTYEESEIVAQAIARYKAAEDELKGRLI